MIFDAQNLMSDQQAITASARSTNVIDLRPTGTPYGNTQALKRDIGKGDPIPLLVQVTESFNTLTSLTFTIQTSDDPAFGSGNVDHAAFTVVLATLTAGYKLPYNLIPDALMGPGNQGMKRYLSINYTVTGTNPTLGKITAGVVAGVQTNG